MLFNLKLNILQGKHSTNVFLSTGKCIHQMQKSTGSICIWFNWHFLQLEFNCIEWNIAIVPLATHIVSLVSFTQADSNNTSYVSVISCEMSSQRAGHVRGNFWLNHTRSTPMSTLMEQMDEDRQRTNYTRGWAHGLLKLRLLSIKRSLGTYEHLDSTSRKLPSTRVAAPEQDWLQQDIGPLLGEDFSIDLCNSWRESAFRLVHRWGGKELLKSSWFNRWTSTDRCPWGWTLISCWSVNWRKKLSTGSQGASSHWETRGITSGDIGTLAPPLLQLIKYGVWFGLTFGKSSFHGSGTGMIFGLGSQERIILLGANYFPARSPASLQWFWFVGDIDLITGVVTPLQKPKMPEFTWAFFAPRQLPQVTHGSPVEYEPEPLLGRHSLQWKGATRHWMRDSRRKYFICIKSGSFCDVALLFCYFQLTLHPDSWLLLFFTIFFLSRSLSSSALCLLQRRQQVVFPSSKLTQCECKQFPLHLPSLMDWVDERETFATDKFSLGIWRLATQVVAGDI